MRKGQITSVLALAACVAFVGCVRSPGTERFFPPSPTNISGQYTGTLDDAQTGSGTVTGALAQQGAAAGGQITDTEASGPIDTVQVSLAVNRSNAVSGSMVFNYPGGVICTMKTTGTYDSSTNVLSGSYTAVTNCSGDTGTYSLTQECTETETSADRRTMGIPSHC
jgi:hypothetical protein